MADSGDEAIRVYSRILGIRANMSDPGYVPAEQCREYDALVQRASAALGTDLSEFAISNSYRSGQHRPNDSVHNDLHYADGVKGRVDGLLNYLRSQVPAEAVQRIGFPSP